MGEKTKRQKALEHEFLAVHSTHANALFRHCVSRVRDRELAKDIVHETFARTWMYVAEGKHVDHMRAFLYRTLNNLIVDTIRKQRTVSLDAMQEDDHFEPMAEPHEPPPELREEMRTALALISSLDDTYASVITMRYIDGFSHGEIANILNLSENVVSVRIHRGTKKLRELWKTRTQHK